MESCCTVPQDASPGPIRCPACGKAGRRVEPITVKAMLGPKALARASDPEHRFCATASCPVVYFGANEAFFREDVIVPVFQKDPPGQRIVCYCFGVGEVDIRRERLETAGAQASERIRALVKEGRCACEVKNPQGSCCLGNIATLEKEAADLAATT
jgi:Zinc binding domain